MGQCPECNTPDDLCWRGQGYLSCECGYAESQITFSTREEVADINRRLKSHGVISLTENQFIAMLVYTEWRQGDDQLDGAVEDAIRVVEEVKRRQQELEKTNERAEADRLIDPSDLPF